MRKKLFTILTAVLFVVCSFGSPALACSGWGCQEANGLYEGQAVSSDFSQSGSCWGNDTASSVASGASYGLVNTHASGFLVGQESGFVSGENTSNAWSYTKDYGQTSKAGAGAVTEGHMLAGGEAFGLFCDRETVNTTVQVGGLVEQSNAANEIGYAGGDGVGGGSFSGAEFTAINYGGDGGSSFAADMKCISGKAITKGETYVTIDPDGRNQSLFGTTSAMSQIEVCGCPDSYKGSVYGNGGVEGGVSNGNTFGSASASFAYTGSHAGSGAATINVNIYNGGNHSTVNVSGHSYATGN
jgi:hypothetical protein